MMTDDTISLYRRLALGGVGMIITGDFSVLPAGSLSDVEGSTPDFSYDDVRIRGYDRLVSAVREVSPECRIIAQISAVYQNVSPSGVVSPFAKTESRTLSTEEIKTMIRRFVVSIEGAMKDGFDGVQFHAAHGGLLSQFMSPYTNRRADDYGGSPRNRVRIISEIVSKARKLVNDFPILIKLNCTDYIDGGISIDSFPQFAAEVERAGVDAIEVSGGMRECLVRSEHALGFPPVFPPESHTRLTSPERQSYFLKYVEGLNLTIPIILVGGNRDIERLENIARQGQVDFISLCRPLICEPDLPNRWRNGLGKSDTECTSCNSCIYDMIVSCSDEDSGPPRCLLREDPSQVKEARKWLTSYAQRNLRSGRTEFGR
jgi:2,4-dienoyl-CoA reductase-like NADH-dependent reductase (Old Yellow Enzyme family)